MKYLFREWNNITHSPDRRAVLTGSLASIAAIATPSANAAPQDPIPGMAERYKAACQNYSELDIPVSASFEEEIRLLKPRADAYCQIHQEIINTPAPSLQGIASKLRLFLDEMTVTGNLDNEFDLVVSALKDCEKS